MLSDHRFSRVHRKERMDQACCRACASQFEDDDVLPSSSRLPIRARRPERLAVRARSGGSVHDFPVTKDVIVIGRKSTHADVVLPDPSISRAHCRFVFARDRVMVEDLGSACGTVLNGHNVTRTTLHWGDIVRVGNSELEIVRA
jgi:hypothetical protein